MKNLILQIDASHSYDAMTNQQFFFALLVIGFIFGFAYKYAHSKIIKK